MVIRFLIHVILWWGICAAAQQIIGQSRGFTLNPFEKLQAAAVGGDALWSWPRSTTLTLGTEEVSSFIAVGHAGRSYFSLSIDTPATACASGNNSSQVGSVMVHTHEYVIQAVIHISSLSTATLILKPEWLDSYAVELSAIGPNISLRSWRGSVGTALGPISSGILAGAAPGPSPPTQERWIWVSFLGRGGSARLSLGSGPVLGLDVALDLTDTLVGVVRPGGVQIVLARAGLGTTIEVCPVNLSEPVLFPIDHPAPLLKLVRFEANQWDCDSHDFDVPVLGAATDMAQTTPLWPLRLQSSLGHLTYVGRQFSFMHGGHYRLCYKPDADTQCLCSGGQPCRCTSDNSLCTPSTRVEGSCEPFVTTVSQNAILPISLLIIGVSSPCLSTGCLESEPWHCYFQFFGESTGVCSFDFSPVTGRMGWSIIAQGESRMALSPAWQPDSLSAGLLHGSFPERCGQAAPGVSAPFGAALRGSWTAVLTTERLGVVTLPSVSSTQNDPFTATVCYCPGLTSSNTKGACGSREDYVQPFGRLFMWRFEVCDINSYYSCQTPFLRVVPQQRFVPLVRCPPGACSAGFGSRIKFIDSFGPSLANWDVKNRCQLKDTVEPSPWAVWERGPDTDGGPRSDYRSWNNNQLLVDMTLGEELMVCYCDFACTVAANWVEVGRVRTALTFSFASTSRLGVSTIQYVNRPGIISFYAGITSDRSQPFPSTYDSSTFSGSAIMKVLSFDREQGGLDSLETTHQVDVFGTTQLQTALDSSCRGLGFNQSVDFPVQGIETLGAAIIQRASVGSNTSRYLSFDGGKATNVLTPKRAGTVVVCYCARLSPGSDCLQPGSWIFGGLLQIRGPRENQLWFAPTRVVVGLENLEGWGLDPSDTLRLIEPDGMCVPTAGYSLLGSTAFKLGCPRGSGSLDGCRKAAQTDILAVSLKSSSTTGLVIIGIKIEGPQSSILTFNGSINNHLQPGDAITIRPESIMFGGQPLPSLSDAERFEVFLLSGYAPFEDDNSQRYIRRWHKVQYLDPSEDLNYATKLRIPIGWSVAQWAFGSRRFSFALDALNADGQPQWVRRNMLSSKMELKALEEVAVLKVCWAAKLPDATYAYAEVGQLSFKDPKRMPAAVLAFTSRQDALVAPVVISFSTGTDTVSYSQSLTSEMVLTIRFHNVLKIMSATTSGTVFETFSSIPVDSMSQAVCGELFLELWSNDLNGFPVPRGCYYGALGDTGEGLERELFVVFDRFNGLRNRCDTLQHTCIYQIVFNARSSSVDPSVPADSQLVDLDISCRYEGGGCKSRFDYLERGLVVTDATSGPTLAEATKGVNARFDDVSGFQLLNASSAIESSFELSTSSSSLYVALRTSVDRGIGQGTLLRIFLAPLTQWDLGVQGCQVACLAKDVMQCGGNVTCVTETTGKIIGMTAKQNVMKLVLPLPQDPVLGNRSLRLRLFSLSLPMAALLPTRLAAQLSSSTDSAPHCAMSAGYITFLSGAAPSTDSRLVVTGLSGSGPQPFVGSKNELYVRLRFSATLWGGQLPELSSNYTDPAAMVELSLPWGFTCAVYGGGRAPHSFDDEATWKDFTLAKPVDAAYNNSVEMLFLLDRDGDQFADFPRSSLSAASTDGSWGYTTGSTCVYTLAPGQTLFAGQVIFVKLEVTNPTWPLRSTSASNVWRVRLSGRGMRSSGALGSTRWDNFSATRPTSLTAPIEPGLWSSNAVVLGSLRDVIVQSSECVASRQNRLSIFFLTSLDAGRNAQLSVVAPDGFRFAAACAVSDLADIYYDPDNSIGTRTRRLPDPGACKGVAALGAKYLSRAEILLRGRLRRDSLYAFSLVVQNPYSSPADLGWYIYTADSSGLLVEGTAAITLSTAWNVGAWRLCSPAAPQAPPALRVLGGHLRPYSFFHSLETLVLSGLRITGTDPLLTSLRISAPSCCVFEPPSNGDAMLDADDGSFRVPALAAAERRALVWPLLTLLPGTNYSARASLRVLQDTRKYSAPQTFVLELGYRSDAPEERLAAIAYAAPPLQMVWALRLGYLSSRVGLPGNELTFQFCLVSAVPALSNAALVFQGSESLRGSLVACYPQVVAGLSLPLPADLDCEEGLDAGGAPHLRLEPQASALDAGCYALRIAASNPAAPVGTSATWTVGTYQGINAVLLDAPAVAVLTLKKQLLAADLSVVPNRSFNSRPGGVTSALVGLRADLKPGVMRGDLFLVFRAPLGYVFAESCFATAFAALDVVAPYPPYTDEDDLELAKWNASDVELGCDGSLNAVNISLPRGLRRARYYSFVIEVTNPLAAPARNFWSVEYGLETSNPLAGLDVATIEFAGPPVATNVGLGGFGLQAPVSLTFELQHSLPGGGSLQLSAPFGFVLLRALAFGPLGTDADRSDTEKSGVLSSWKEQYLEMRLPSTMALVAHLTYALEVLVMNPSEQPVEGSMWRLASFTTTGTLVDEGAVAGYSLFPVAVFGILNVFGQQNSLDPVLVSVSFEPTENIGFGDLFRLYAPEGYSLLSTSPSTCSGMRWTQWQSQLPRPVPMCSCPLGPCQLQFNVEGSIDQLLNLSGVAYRKGAILTFQVSSHNPTTNPPLSRAFWRMTHMKAVTSAGQTQMVVVSVGIQQNWHIQPQLHDVVVKLVGSSQAAGAESSLSLVFVPMNNADVVLLVAEYPGEVSFDKAAVQAPVQKGTGTSGSSLVITNLGLTSGLTASILITAVKLGRGGGISMFSLTSYSDASLRYKVDESLHFTAFRQPGSVTIVDGTLQGSYAMNPLQFPLQSVMQPRAGEKAVITFNVIFSYPVVGGDHLIISSEGAGAYTLVVDSRVIVGRVTGGVLIPLLAVATLGNEESIDILIGNLSTSTVLFAVGNLARAIVWCLPTLGVNTWRIETYSNSLELTNTNDGGSVGFTPVTALQVVLQAERSPPQSLVEVKLQVSAISLGSESVPEMLVVAPRGFVFPEVCGDRCTSRGETFQSTGLQVATLTSLTLATLLDIQLTFNVLTPQQTPAGVDWVVIARAVSGRDVGWGLISGFKVNQMLNTEVAYAPIVGLVKGELVVSFTVSSYPQDWRVSIIEIVAPTNFTLSCFGSALRPITLPPRSVPTCEDGQGAGRLRLSLGSIATLLPGGYALSVQVALPLITPVDNTVAVIIRESSKDLIVDATFNLPEPPLLTTLPLTQPNLAWTTAEVAEISVVTVAFALTNFTNDIFCLLFSLPDGFMHRVRRAADLKVYNTELPLRRGGSDWVDFSAPQRLRLILETNDNTMDVGSYFFSFPVAMPKTMEGVPIKNIWRLSFCRDRSCSEYSDGSVLVSFPMAGFQPGQESVLEQTRAQVRDATLGITSAAGDFGQCACRCGFFIALALVLVV